MPQDVTVAIGSAAEAALPYRSGEDCRYTPPTEPPPVGIPQELVPGIFWFRVPLPYLFDHINIYLFEEPDGWTVWDTGVDMSACREIWTQLLAGFFAGKPPIRVICSHFHPDHMGLAGWLDAQFGTPIYMTMGDYLLGRLLQAGPEPVAAAAEHRQYRRLGLTDAEIAEIPSRAESYKVFTHQLPGSYRRLAADQHVELGGRHWRVLTGGGHAPELLMLWCAADGLLLSSDQVLPFLVPDVNVIALEPAADPLSLYLGSLAALRAALPDPILVLPSHYLPFRGLHGRILQLERHHADRAALLLGRCRQGGMSAAALAQTLFRRKLNPQRLSAVAESVLAHLHYLLASHSVIVDEDKDGVARFSAVG
jgi:glyoxylase-like metal-dependent hydrolase (beta-lactamase superfamily II)